MAFDRATLPTDIAALHEIILAQAAENEARAAELAAAKAGLLAKALEVEKLRLQIARLRRMQFERKKRRALPDHLPAREVVHEPGCTCPACGGEMRKVGEDVTEILDYIPG